MRSVRPGLGPVAARRLRHRAATIGSVDELLDLTFEFERIWHQAPAVPGALGVPAPPREG